MSRDLRALWQDAERHEAAGSVDKAADIYRHIVEVDSGQAFAWLRLSLAAQRRDDYLESHVLALTAANTAGEFRRYAVLGRITQRLLAFDERPMVRTLIGNADWNDRLLLQQSAILAQHLSLADGHDQALMLVDHAMKAAPRSHLLHYTRGNALRYLGRLEEATQAYEDAISLAPEFADVHWSLSTHQPSSVPRGRLGRLKRAYEANAPDTLGQAMLGYALFREYDDAGDVAMAWSSLASAASTMRRLVRYAPGTENLTMESLVQEAVSTGDLGVARVGRGQGAATPIFIVGMPRSGTTLLERILGGHPQVASLGEANALRMSLCHAANRFIPADCAWPSTSEPDHGMVAAEYARRTVLKDATVTHVIDKNPMNLFLVSQALAAMPDARVLSLRRDPMDACFACYRELFPGGGYEYSYDLADLAGHCRDAHRLMQTWQDRRPDRFMIVDYEKLVADPETESARILDFCGLPPATGITRIEENTMPSSTASSSQVRRSIHTRSVGGWKRYEAHLGALQNALATPSPPETMGRSWE